MCTDKNYHIVIEVFELEGIIKTVQSKSKFTSFIFVNKSNLLIHVTVAYTNTRTTFVQFYLNKMQRDYYRAFLDEDISVHHLKNLNKKGIQDYVFYSNFIEQSLTEIKFCLFHYGPTLTVCNTLTRTEMLSIYLNLQFFIHI